jgi:hypothetical protein
MDIPIKMCGKNDGHASLKYMLPSMISENASAVNIQLRKFLFLIEIEVDLNNRNILISAGINIQRIASLITCGIFMVV